MTDLELRLQAALSAQATGAVRQPPALATLERSAMDASADTVDATAPVQLELPVGRRNPRRWASAVAATTVAAAVAAAVVGTTVALSRGDDETAPTVGAATSGVAASSAPAATGPYGLKPGEFLHVRAVFDSTPGESTDTWIPADPVGGTWTLHVVSKNPDRTPFILDQRAKCAVFPYYQLAIPKGSTGNPLPGCDTSAGWQLYRPPFVASLPRTVSGLTAALAAAAASPTYAAPGRPIAQTEYEIAEGLLLSGYLPADLSRALFDTVASLPGAGVTHNVPNQAGQFGDGVTMTITAGIKPATTETIIIDPTTNLIIGSIDTAAGHTETQAITRTVTTHAGS